MPAKWQTWMPVHIDAWRRDVDIVALSDAAYRAYSYLLMAAWRSEDGMLPDDDNFLAKHSYMFQRWYLIRGEVLELFERSGDRLYSPITIGDWKRYKALYERQSAGGYKSSLIKGPRRPRRNTRQESHIWVVTRARIFKRDNYTCRYCGAFHCRLECDHVIAVAIGGSNDDDNLVTACKPCNRAKRDMSLEVWRGKSIG